jgi:hypothetical protein
MALWLQFSSGTMKRRAAKFLFLIILSLVAVGCADDYDTESIYASAVYDYFGPIHLNSTSPPRIIDTYFSTGTLVATPDDGLHWLQGSYSGDTPTLFVYPGVGFQAGEVGFYYACASGQENVSHRGYQTYSGWGPIVQSDPCDGGNDGTFWVTISDAVLERLGTGSVKLEVARFSTNDTRRH